MTKSSKRVKNLIFVMIALLAGVLLKVVHDNYLKPIIILNGDLHDYGTISKGDDGTHKITFTNGGLLPLKILNVSADCGCTVVSWDKSKVKSGESGVITIEYDTHSVGLINRIVSIESNANKEIIPYYLIGNVMPIN